MMDRLEVFQCKKIASHRPGMELLFRKHAMEIIHWMADFIKDMPLWEDSDIRGEELNIDLETSDHYTPPVINLSDLEEVNESILPRSTVVRAHLDVYDTTADTQVIPYRLTSNGYDVASEEYHRSVYLDIQGKFVELINKDVGYDLEALFRSRRQVGWLGVDSLYHAWLFVNFRRSPPGFSMKLFSQRYPDWRNVMMQEMDLTPEIPDSLPNSQTSGIKSEPAMFRPTVFIEDEINLCSEDDDAIDIPR